MQQEQQKHIEYSLEQIAKEINGVVCCDLEHQYKLRRALLNSSFYNESILVRFYSRVVRRNKKVFIVSSAVCISVCILFISNSFLRIENLYYKFTSLNAPIERVYAKDMESEMLQKLYKYGYLQYSHQDAEGNRVYAAQKKAKTLNVIDSEPYKIDLVLAD